MNKTYRPARPHRVLDAYKLDWWLSTTHPALMDEYQFSDAADWIELWDWLDAAYPDVLDAFCSHFRRI